MTKFSLRASQRILSVQRKSRQLLMESLEDRSLMAALASGIDTKAVDSAVADSPVVETAAITARKVTPNLTNRAAALVDDSYENNDTQATATNLGTLTAPKTLSNLVMADSGDWYKFTTTAPTTVNDKVTMSFVNSRGDLDLALYNAAGTRLRISNSVSNSETVSLSGLAAGTYFIRAYGYQGAQNPAYSLTVSVTSSTTTPAPVTDDTYENNDTFATARDLGSLSAATTISTLVMADGHDWYKFTMGGAGTTNDFVAVSSSSTQGDLDLELYNATGTRLAISDNSTNSEQISLAGKAAGTYYVHVIGFNNAVTPTYSLQIDPGVATSGGGGTGGGGGTPTPGAFDIQFRFTGLSASLQAVFEQAAAKWESVITGDLPSATYAGVAVDDLLIDASGVAIDGTGNVLGQAGPDAFRSGSRLPYHGEMEFDTADLASMQANGTLLGVIEHEMGHVLGIGTLWSTKGLLSGANTTNPIFVGAQATAAYNSIFGTNAAGVPVENTGGSGTRNSHWRESTFGNELMTGWVGPGSNMPLSRITIGSLADIGYTVNYAAADPYTRTSALTAIVSATVPTSTTTSSARVTTTQTTPVALPLASRYRDDVFAAVATGTSGDDRETAISNCSQQQHEAATDSLFANWDALLRGRNSWA